MIAALAAYDNSIITASSTSGSDARIQSRSSDIPSATSETGTSPTDPVELSASHDVFSAVDTFFNLGSSGGLEAFHSLSPADKEQFVRIVSTLAQSGYIGYEELEVNKKLEKHDATTKIGDDRLYHARVYDRSKNTYR